MNSQNIVSVACSILETNYQSEQAKLGKLLGDIDQVLECIRQCSFLANVIKLCFTEYSI